MGYNRIVFNELVKNYNVNLYVVAWDKNTVSDYKTKESINFKLYKRSQFSTSKCILAEFEDKNIQAVMASGWMDKSYLSVCKYYKANGKVTICTLDSQWRNTFKQNIGRLWAKFFITPAFTHAFVAGLYQYEFARKIGFDRNRISTGCYSADTKLFQKESQNLSNYPKKILFVGRFIEKKGLRLLIEVFTSLPSSIRKEWSLTLIGSGKLPILNYDNIEIKPFLQPNELAKEVSNYGLFCLPSSYEPWGVVVHEMVSAGLPILCSSECGSKTVFLKSGFNGFEFESGNFDDLRKKLLRFCKMSERELQTMSNNSKTLASQISPKTWAVTFMSFLSS